MPIKYLIGAADPGPGMAGFLTVVGYDWSHPVAQGGSAGYCNFNDEKATGAFGSYMDPDDVSRQYNEPMPDPHGSGFERNIRAQLERRKRQGFKIVEIDNASAYPWFAVKKGLDIAAELGLDVLAKNPMISEGFANTYVAHKAVRGVIVEEDCGGPTEHHELRMATTQGFLPVYFVGFQHLSLMQRHARRIETEGYAHMSVSFSKRGEYETSCPVS